MRKGKKEEKKVHSFFPCFISFSHFVFEPLSLVALGRLLLSFGIPTAKKTSRKWRVMSDWWHHHRWVSRRRDGKKTAIVTTAKTSCTTTLWISKHHLSHLWGVRTDERTDERVTRYLHTGAKKPQNYVKLHILYSKYQLTTMTNHFLKSYDFIFSWVRSKFSMRMRMRL